MKNKHPIDFILFLYIYIIDANPEKRNDQAEESPRAMSLNEPEASKVSHRRDSNPETYMPWKITVVSE